MMLLDYIWFFLLLYIFVFTATNLAMTISGNAITQIVLTILILFLIPYTSFYINTLKEINGKTEITKFECNKEECMPDKYYCYDSSECEFDKELNRYRVSLFEDKTTNYTTPFNIFASLINVNSSIINTTSVITSCIIFNCMRVNGPPKALNPILFAGTCAQYSRNATPHEKKITPMSGQLDEIFIS